MYKDKTLLITGGTGSFGHAVLRRFLQTTIGEIRIFSRDEKKQDSMRKFYQDSRIKFYLGDVRDISSIRNAIRGVDFVFHAAALKQVPSCEFHPLEAIKTNTLGTENLLEESILAGVKKIICLSTDKAVYPINAMGLSKALMEKIMITKSRLIDDSKTIICGTRYGNVMASSGSVIPLFMNQLKNNLPLTITDPRMTRFMMSLDDAIDLTLYAFEHGSNGDIFVQKSPAATMEILAKSILEITDKRNHPIKIIGTRHGEKLYETLLSREERATAQDLGKYFRILPDLRDLNYGKFTEEGVVTISECLDYNSHNTQQLDLDGMQELLLKINIHSLTSSSTLEFA